MKKYNFSFIGRKAGAIGATYEIEVSTRANSLKEAELKLYDNYDHISRLTQNNS